MASKCSIEACARLLAGASHAGVAADALREWAGRRDPSACYHTLSTLSRNYYGWRVRLAPFEEYYKTLRGSRTIKLPQPIRLSGMDVLEAIRRRESRRRYSRAPITLVEAASLLYYTVGVTGREWWGGPKRVYPSAGALQPVEAYLLAGDVDGLEAGVYHYNPGTHSLEEISWGDPRQRLYEASLEQEHLRDAPATIVLTIVYPRTASKYDVRAYRYALMDAGFAGENLYLAAEALGLATVAVGAFYDDEVCGMLRIDCRWEYPLLLFPIGHRRS